MLGVPADSRVPPNGSLVSKGSTRVSKVCILICLRTSSIEIGSPILGPRFVTPAPEAGAFCFFEVASTLDLVLAVWVSVDSFQHVVESRSWSTHWWCSSNVRGA